MVLFIANLVPIFLVINQERTIIDIDDVRSRTNLKSKKMDKVSS